MQNSRGDNKHGPIAGDSISMDEALASCLLFFEDVTRSLSKSPEELFDDFDSHLGVGWEVREEILAGKALMEWDKISIEKRNLIKNLVLTAEEMPKSAYAGIGLEDLLDPAWQKVRSLASDFINHS